MSTADDYVEYTVKKIRAVKELGVQISKEIQTELKRTCEVHPELSRTQRKLFESQKETHNAERFSRRHV